MNCMAHVLAFAFMCCMELDVGRLDRSRHIGREDSNM